MNFAFLQTDGGNNAAEHATDSEGIEGNAILCLTVTFTQYIYILFDG